ncbi:hypothetical protein [Pedobacter sp. SL55]|uniref:hypothetical protein n=1 Tax=Pedobacter sp. SL55 TaxID=2995161 RepID=UPI00226E8388|nr:hypothetical protein [Pedobacter sp. SL55]WAC42579.1 hypothetical protein OVA16_09555 [Pedobacter sp. SL55]
MKNLKIVLLVGLITLCYACHDTTQNNDEQAVEAASTDTTNLAKADGVTIETTPPVLEQAPTEEASINYSDSINFERYKVEAEKIEGRANLDWDSYPEAKTFRTRIIQAYSINEVDFAGYYVTSIFGCGASCLMGFMVDVRDGKIYDLPLGEENSCFFAEDRASYNWMSRLFIAAVCKENLEDKKVYYKAYLWDEDKKEFEKVEQEKFLVKK